ncbi:MAG: peptidase M23 [Betaproteobacteria bacterium CG2_30_59_46]|nr:MAG: peptidase M23 [Betaproteobacteria bacterium CG2_30_59_46]PIQ14085.1 MAG: peptidase M23 [Hydrogenophilales bacterium CG18_big_fil_WC_8_21_14_2_50_58_12]PIY01882.1 MAG: peptidase M23 [Hydrogenophilales bacterium CG_4_10_14_3_um_filter_58_23]PJB07365.1 MAG: peptidase M23 [Hydrogenophilales bacterium CG_4_9_14_3_um_filter_59_35]
MNIILVSGKLAKGKTVALSHTQVMTLGMALLAFPLLLAMAFTYLLLFHAADIPHPYLQSLVLSAQRTEAAKSQVYLRENLSAMAVKLGQMQAQVLRLDSLGERLATLTGMGKQEFNFDKKPGQGGAESSLPARDMTLSEFGHQLDDLMKKLDDRSDQLGLMESVLVQQQAKKVAMPSARPVSVGWYSSNFGYRIDPFTGQKAFHEGVDFVADSGTAIHAAGGGIVVYADTYAGYGNMIEIDHGNGLISRYAHASKVLAKVGDVVMKGQKIGEVGTTGRSTGPHLHFEVRLRGAPQNPEHYLQQS